jgi:hypothetical protein
MKRIVFGPTGVLALLAAISLSACTVESSLPDAEVEGAGDATHRVDVGSEGQEIPASAVIVNRPTSRRPSQGSAAPEVDPIDPWKSIQGPVPDPWHVDPAPPTPGRRRP